MKDAKLAGLARHYSGPLSVFSELRVILEKPVAPSDQGIRKGRAVCAQMLGHLVAATLLLSSHGSP